MPRAAVTSPIGRGYCRARLQSRPAGIQVTAGRGSNLPYRAGLLPRPVTAAPGSNLNSCQARILAGRGSNLPYRAGLLPPSPRRRPEGRGYCRSNPGTSRAHSESAVTPPYVTVGRNNVKHSEFPRKRGVYTDRIHILRM